MRTTFIIAAGWLAAGLLHPGAALAQEDDPAEVVVGERLFLETRFAQFFFAHATDVNVPLAAGDPTVAVTQTSGNPLPGPFAGQSMNCRACHLVDEQGARLGAGNRTYADFARRSPVPDRGDGHTETVRNTPALVGAAPVGRPGRLLHFDGEFPSTADLVAGTYTGRNFGWLPAERATAVAHIANVIRNDDGRGALAREFGGPYRAVLRGGLDVPAELRLPKRLRIDVEQASDEEILQGISRIVAAYVTSLEFARDLGGFHGSPFDVFLGRNGAPRQLRAGQSQARFSRTLRARLAQRDDFAWVGIHGLRPMAFHDQPFRFGPEELRGLRIFIGAGNCVSCHPLPTFTDFAAHNTGVSQRGYEAAHGEGSFMALAIPDLATRNGELDQHLPATAAHPNALEPFRRLPAAEAPGRADLGLWNVFANPDLPNPEHQKRPELQDMVLGPDDVAPLTAFLRALNEDYE